MAAHSNNEATMRSLGTQSRRLTEGMKDLEKLNINTTLSSLPKYVVVGDQSAGKSSIVQALCGVSLPRSQGTTTRCPFRITTSKGTKSTKSWTCTVSLQQHSDLHGRGQWRRRDELKITHFATIYDEGELEAVLRRAQLALLNPQEDPKHFLDVDWNKHTNNKAVFSPNILSLEIQASRLPELEFYDLPGCINSYDLPKSTKADAKQRQKEEKDLIQMIKSTVVSYIKEENCLILLACSADQDLEMSLTMKHIRDNDAEGRCIGVLTKADLVPPAKIPAILEILEGKKYQLEHPWFITKQPSQQEIAEGLDHDAAREREIEFFATSPWAENTSSREQYGISQLSSQIALNLSDHILSELPNMMQRVRSRIADVTAQLDQFPEPPRKPKQVITNLIRQVVECLVTHINATSDENRFRAAFDDCLKNFSEELRVVKLDVHIEIAPYTAVDPEPNDDDAEIKQSRNSRTSASDAELQRKRKAEVPLSRPAKRRISRATVDHTTLRLNDLKDLYKIGATNSIPGSINDKVTEQLIRRSCSKWTEILEQLLRDVSSLVRNIIAEAVDDAVGAWSHTQVYEQTRNALLAHFNKTMTAESGAIKQQLSRMQKYPTTFSDGYEVKKAAYREGLARERHTQPLYEHEMDSKSVNERLANDEFGSMIDWVAIIYTFHDIMSERFADSVSVDLKAGVLENLKEETAEMLEDALDAFNTERCAALLAEDQDREQQRKKLVAKKNKLEQAAALVENLQDMESQYR